MSDRYPYDNTTNKISSELAAQFETPLGAQQKADAAREAAEDVSDAALQAHRAMGGNEHPVATGLISGFMSGPDKTKLDTVQPGAQKNKHGYSAVNGMVASTDEDGFTINGLTGIEVTKNELTKAINITATGESIPGKHGEAHLSSGADPIPEATLDESGLMSAMDKRALESTTQNILYYGVKGDGSDESELFQTIIDNMNDGETLFIPKGEYIANVNIDKNIGLQLENGAKINSSITYRGKAYDRSNTTISMGGWDVFTPNTKNFPGDFSSFSPGDVVVVEPTVLDGLYNQCGVDFLIVESASSSILTTTFGTNFSYNNPKISKINNAVFIDGSLSENSIYIQGNFTEFFEKGDVIRLENREATTGVENSNFVFELNKIVEIDNEKITLENRLTHGFSKYWIVKFSTLKNINISGGFVQEVNVFNCENLQVNNAVFSDIHLQYIYDFSISSLEFRNNGTPQAFELTFAYNGTVSDVRAKGSRGLTDNACVKYMSCINVVTNNLVSLDTMSTAEGVYPFYIDYYFTPYKNWNDKLTVNNLSLSGNKNEESPDAWVIGVKNSLFSNMAMYWWPKFDLIRESVINGVYSEKRIILSGIEKSIISNISAGSVDMSNCKNSQLVNSRFSGEDNLFLRTIWARGCENIDFNSIKIGSNNNDSFYLEESNRISIDNCSDGNGTGSSSVALGINLTGLKIGKNDFSKPISGTTGMAPTRHYGIPKAVNLPVFSVGRNTYASKANITGDGTEYLCTFDSDASYFNKNNVFNFDSSTFVVPVNMGGKYRISAQISLNEVNNSHNLGELYLKINGVKTQLAYENIIFPAGPNRIILMKGSLLLSLSPGDSIQCFVRVAGTSKTVVWDFGELGGRFTGEMIFAE